MQTWVPNPVLGDMLYETRYTGYRDFGGAKFPTLLQTHQGDPRLNPGHNFMEIKVANVQPNVTVAPLTVPDNVRQATSTPVRVESNKLADGVWFVGGGTHNSVLVEFRDFVAVVEAPLNEDRSVAVIAEVRKLVPTKPIRYVVNTHHHFDHSGGLRTYAAEGATVVTHQANREFSVAGLAHNSNMLIAFLPKEKILVNADLYTPPARGAQPPANPTPSMVTLYQNIQRLKLDVGPARPHPRASGNERRFREERGEIEQLDQVFITKARRITKNTNDFLYKKCFVGLRAPSCLRDKSPSKCPLPNGTSC